MDLNPSYVRTAPTVSSTRPWTQAATKPVSRYCNGLLRRLEQHDLDVLAPHLQRVRLEANRVLEPADKRIDRIFFPESGVISVIAASRKLNSLEVGVIGSEGMTGLAVVLGDTQSPMEARVQLAGDGYVAAADIVAGLLVQHPRIRRTMLSYAHVFIGQFTQTALANGRGKIDARLARRLLMTADRVGDVEMSLTHEALAAALGVRRPGVTDAIHRLEGQYLIRGRRSSITIRDRRGLEAVAGGFYGEPEREYARAFDDRDTAGAYVE